MPGPGALYLTDQNHNTTRILGQEASTTNLALKNSDDIEVLKHNIDDLFHITMGCFVFFMQPGFAFLEAGSVRSKNTVNIIMKNMLDILVGGVMYWVCGWALAHGSGGTAFSGGGNFFTKNLPTEMYPIFFFDYMFASTAITIVSGSIAERCPILAYMVYSVVISGWVYPISAHWLWGRNEADKSQEGWLLHLGCHDFAGSGGVHLLGGVAALVGCYLIRPRKGRFTQDGKPVKIPGHSMPLSALGGFFLVIGFLAFNGGTKVSVSEEGQAANIGVIILNTLLGGCTGGLSVLLLCRVTIEGKWSYHLMLNGMLTGIIAQCAGCDRYIPAFSAVIGVIGGLVYLIGHKSMVLLKLDDPLDAVAVHAGGGILGILVEPFFEENTGIFYIGNTTEPWKKLGVNLLGAIAITAWSGLWSFLVFGILKSHNMLRVDDHTEVYGHDLLHHGEAAYPLDAWLEYQYDTHPTDNKTVVDQMMNKFKHIGKDASVENSSCTKDERKASSTYRKCSEASTDPPTRLSINNQRRSSNMLTIENISRLADEYSRRISNASTVGRINCAFTEEVPENTEAQAHQRPSTISTTTQTKSIGSSSINLCKESFEASDNKPSTGIDELEDRKGSLELMSMRSIAV